MLRFSHLALGLSFSAWFSAHADAQGYTVTDLGYLSTTGSYAVSVSVNDRGEVAGYSDDGNFLQAFHWTPGRGMRGLGYLPQTSASIGTGLSDAGSVVGYAGRTVENTRGFVTTGGSRLTDLGDLGGMETWARDINNLGQVVGESKDLTGFPQAILWQNGSLTNLGLLVGGQLSSAQAISDTGWIAGYSDTTAFLVRAGQVTVLPGLGGSKAIAYDVNDFGVAVGFAWQARGVSCVNCEPRAVMWRDGEVETLGVLAPPTAPSMSSSAHGINNLGQVVGDSTTAPLGTRHGFLWDRAFGLRDLNNLVPAGWMIDSAFAINDAGQIAATGWFAGTPGLRALLLTPVASTPVLINPQPGLAGATNRLEVLGATPGGLVAMVIGFGFGSVPLPFCNTGLELSTPFFVLGGVIADGAGTALMHLPVPASVSGLEAVFQALDLGSCKVSAIAAQTF